MISFEEGGGHSVLDGGLGQRREVMQLNGMDIGQFQEDQEATLSST